MRLRTGPSASRTLNLILALAVAAVVLLSVVQALRLRETIAASWDIPPESANLFHLDYFLGELVRSIAEHARYHACYNEVKSAHPATLGLCFSAARMPVTPLFLGLVAVVANNLLVAAALKTTLVALALCIAIVWTVPPWRRLSFAVFGMLFFYFVNPANVLMLVQLTTEEAFLMPEMAVIAALLFGWRCSRGEYSRGDLIVYAVVVALLPLTKSSALPAALVLAAIPMVAKFGTRGLRWLPAATLVAGLMAWGTVTWISSGHFSLGSSLNGYNLHQGNNEHYGEVAPRYHPDTMVARGQISLTAPVTNEWEFDRQFTERAIGFVARHPLRSVQYLGIKIYVAFFKVTPEYRPEDRKDSFFVPKYLLLTIGLVFDKLLLWGAFLYAAATCWRVVKEDGWRNLAKRQGSLHAAAVIIVILAWAFPFILAFPVFRHMMPIYYFLGAYMASCLMHISSRTRARALT